MSNIIPSTSAAPATSAPDGTDTSRLVELWLRGKSKNTVDAYRRDVRSFLKLVDKSISEVKLQDIWNWVDTMDELGYRPATRSRKIAAVKSLFSFGHKTGYLSFNVGAAISLPHVPDLLAERILSEEAIFRLLDSAASLRDRLILRLFYSSGARVSEMTILKWKDFHTRSIPGDLESGQVTLLGKGSKTRSVLISRATWLQVIQFKSEETNDGHGSPADPVFRSPYGGHLSRQTIWRVVKNAARMAGLPNTVSPHWLRHAHASHAMDHGAPTHLVKETLGHKSLATTSRYAHARPDDSSGRYLKI